MLEEDGGLGGACRRPRAEERDAGLLLLEHLVFVVYAFFVVGLMMMLENLHISLFSSSVYLLQLPLIASFPRFCMLRMLIEKLVSLLDDELYSSESSFGLLESVLP